MSGLVIAVDVGSTRARAGVFDARRPHARARPSTAFDVNRPAPRSRRARLRRDLAGGLPRRSAARSRRRAHRADRRRRPRLRRDLLARACSTARGGPSSVSTGRRRPLERRDVGGSPRRRRGREITATGTASLDYVGGVMSPEMELPKLLWLKRHLPARLGALRARARPRRLPDLAGDRRRSPPPPARVTCKWTYLNHESQGWQARPPGAHRPRRSAGAAAASRHGRRRSAPRAGSLAARRRGRTRPGARRCAVGVGLIDAHAGGLGLLGRASRVGARRRHRADRRHLDLPHGGVAGAAADPGRLGSLLRRHAAGALAERGRAIRDRRAARPRPRLARRRAGARARPARRRRSARSEDGCRGAGPELRAAICRSSPTFTATARRSPIRPARRDLRPRPRHSSTASRALYYATAVGIALGTRHIIDDAGPRTAMRSTPPSHRRPRQGRSPRAALRRRHRLRRRAAARSRTASSSAPPSTPRRRRGLHPDLRAGRRHGPRGHACRARSGVGQGARRGLSTLPRHDREPRRDAIRLEPDRRLSARSGRSAGQRMPARMKLCTNWRWNRRKPRRRGPEVIRVAAQITDQSMP